jgi:phosphoribosylamine---glycine ligase
MQALMLSPSGDAVGIAKRLNEEGHDVTIHIQEDDFGDACGGMVPQVIDWSLKVDSETVVVADCTGNGDVLDIMRLHAVRVVGGCYLADRLEEDRQFANEVMEQAGLEVPLTKFFNDWDKAREYVEQVGDDSGVADEKLYFKPCGRLSGNMPSYGSNNTEELLEMLEYYQGKIHGTPEIAIQHGVDGIDISTEGWFDGQNFVPSAFNHTLETKHMLDGDTGPSGGCTGNVVWACTDSCPLCEELLKIEDWLRENNYAPGPIDLNAVVGDEGVFALEFTPRFGYDATPTLVYELVEDFGGFLEALANRDNSSVELAMRPGFAAGLRLSIPPWPSTAEHKAESGLPVQGLMKSVWEHFCPMGVMLNEHGDEVTSTVGGILGVATGYGETVGEAFEQAYRIAKRITVPDKQMRTDLIEHFDKKYRKVAKLLTQLA